VLWGKHRTGKKFKKPKKGFRGSLGGVGNRGKRRRYLKSDANMGNVDEGGIGKKLWGRKVKPGNSKEGKGQGLMRCKKLLWLALQKRGQSQTEEGRFAGATASRGNGFQRQAQSKNSHISRKKLGSRRKAHKS